MISVLMSVYNETVEEISQSIDSILTQSYRHFELIVVVDNPTYTIAIDLLSEYAKLDSRVKIIVNKENIGLAMSMNVAAEVASGEYMLRMDADDICMPDRFQMQYDIINGSKYDLVCGNYDFIDENGEALQQKASVYTDKQISVLLPYRNIIHHPTVIMRAETFRRMGGYRNYKCAQDYDLWLRMKKAGCNFHMMPEKLIKYRVRQASTTLQNRYKQSCTGDYIRSLYQSKTGMDGYSYDGYLKFLAEHKAEDKEAQKDFINNSTLYFESKKKLYKGHIVSGLKDLFNVVFNSKYYRPDFLRSLIIFLITKFVK